ncbi:hypothetical protein Kpol_1036p72 [Vanderwaltozyma polyspora DSM 70294]|uniref:Choline kinase N-terminal domain-containing protein n=1 Tax=Vanderwaltozyma polyspora (strain ATCC 22028 / DSM 70294 / BCRC 21397 / CBS 2163 / NBRC 10782 / NRRL Y-8283 / UCD 57-17) TaxID=436907 RepID=A7TEL9_VANPO|nr:uncharacterized protein Kpol_1036p72 [Vanderwaltozyma polyspora DSM 70294]EDO19326.1 hypothetical protein Kpol_1036p72 [Vanderwaltozyma polyspora DSM 70294]
MPVERKARSEVSRGQQTNYVKSRSRSRSSSKTRNSLTIQVSSNRSVRAISVDSDNESAIDDGSETSMSLKMQGLNLDENQNVNSDDGNGNVGASASANGGGEYIEVPFVEAILDTSLPSDYLKDDILNIAQSLKVPKWYVKGAQGVSPLKREFLKMTQITGAMSNVIYKLEYPHLPSLLLRVYGPNIDSIIDRDYELQILARLSLQNIGPSLFGCFTNGRFEQFLENSQTLTKDDIRDWKTSQRIARRMKELHIGVPLLRSEREGGPACIKLINKWMTNVETIGKEWISDNENINDVLFASDWSTFRKVVARYVQWLKDEETGKYKEKLVFCHNDTQYGNLLLSAPVTRTEPNTPSGTRSTASLSSLFPTSSNISLDDIIFPPKEEKVQDDKLIVIDFEYAGPNPAAFDLANHFSEWMHDYHSSEPYKCNSKAFPTKEQELNFLYSYVSHLRGGAKNSIDDEVRTYYNSIIRWRASVQLFWSLWAIIQSGKLEEKELEHIEMTKEAQAPSGNKYIIKTELIDSSEDGSTSQETTEESSQEEANGADIGSFDYMGFCRDKISLFWGDLFNLGIIERDECSVPLEKNFLDVKFL